MESESHDVLLVPYTSGTIAGYGVSTEASPSAAPSTTFTTISVKKFERVSTSSSVQSTESLIVKGVAVTSFENTSASDTPTTSSASSSSLLSTLMQSSNSSSSVISTSTIVTPLPTSAANLERTTSILSSRINSISSEITIQTTSLTPPPTILPTSTETLLVLPTTSAPRFTHSPEPSSSQESIPSRKPLTITFTTLGSVSLVLLLITLFIFRRRRRGSGRYLHLPPKTMRESRRRTAYELITSANVHEKDGKSVDLFRKGSLRSLKGSFRRGRERVHELECEDGREEVNWMNLKNRVRERTVERLGSTLGIEGRPGVRDGDGGRGGTRTGTGKSVRWAVG